MKSKTFKNLSLLMLIALLSLNINSYAQRGGMNKKSEKGMRYRSEMQCNQKDLKLTDEQAAKIKDLRIACQKEVLPLNNLLGEKRAHMKTLTTAEKADLKGINKLIDEMSVIKTKIMKKRAANRLEIRSLLTDEQKLIFDSRHHNRNSGMKNHMKQGCNKQGKGMRKPGSRKF